MYTLCVKRDSVKWKKERLQKEKEVSINLASHIMLKMVILTHQCQKLGRRFKEGWLRLHTKAFATDNAD